MHVNFPISLKWSSTGVIWMFRTSFVGRSLTHFTLSFIFYKSFWGYWYLVWAISPRLLWASTGNFTKVFFYQVLQGSWPLPRPLISEFTMVKALWPVNASLDWKLPIVPEMEPLNRQRRLIYARLCRKGESGQASADQGFSTGSQGSFHVLSSTARNISLQECLSLSNACIVVF